MLPINLSGKRAFIAGVADDGGFGFAIAKALAEAGASVCVGTWPPALGIFLNLLERGKMAESLRLADGGTMAFEKIYPLDAAFDNLEEAPAELRESKRYKERGDFSIQGVAASFREDFGDQGLDIMVHSLANGPEVKNALLDGSFLSLTYMASERVIPGYGGGMSSAKAALESDTRTLAFEAGRRFGVRVNTISAGPLASRAATAIGLIHRMIEYNKRNAPLTRELDAADVGHCAAFLASPLAAAITGSVLYVDNGYHAMGMAVEGPGTIAGAE
jgi:enoyl-[acyl-carrier protein] reductase I